MKKYYITAWKFALAIRERYEHITAARYVLVRVEHMLFARVIRAK